MTTVSSGGSMYVDYDGTATMTTVSSGGSMYVDGTATMTTVLSGGYLYVYSAGSASIVFSPWRGDVSLSREAQVTYLERDANVYWGNDNSGIIGKEDAVEDIIISSGVSMLIYNSGTANVTTLASGGWMYVSSGGTATETMVSPGGSMTISSGGTASILFNPWMGTVNAMTGASVTYLERDMTVYFGGSSAGLLGRGNTLSNVNVTSGLRTIVYSGGTLNGASLESWGEMYVFSGGRVTGELNVEQGAVVSAYRGSLIDFDLSERSSDSGALINDLTLVNGVPDYAVTVSSTQTAGTYRLAEGAEFFTGSITVKDAANESYGVLAVGETLTVSGVDYQLNLADGLLSFTVGGNAPVPPVTGTSAKSDVNGNGVSDVLFQYTGGDYQLGFWLDGTNNWQGQGIPESADWDVIGAYDMSSDGQADVVMLGNVTVSGIRGAFVGYRKNGDMSSWENISYLTNAEGVDWQVKVGNLTGNEGKNSILWHAPDLGAVGVWTDGTDNWVSLGAGYDRNWEMIGAGDFDGDGADSILFSYANGAKYYALDLDQTATELGVSDSGWEVRAIGDFSGDGKDDIVAFNAATGLVAKWENGNSSSWSSLGQLDAADWFIAGTGDYNGDGTDDLLVRQYSTGMLGYYADADLSKWNEMGRGVDMNWAVIA